MLKETSHKDKISQTTVYEWHRRFSEGRKKLEDMKAGDESGKCGRHKRHLLRKLYRQTRKLPVDRFFASYGTLYQILMEELHMSKVKYIFNVV